HKRFALQCGVQDVFSARNGDICLLKDKHIECLEQIAEDIIGWDRNHPVSLSSEVIKNRKRIAYNCSLFVSAVIKNRELLDLQLSSIDILNSDDWDKLSAEIIAEVKPLIARKLEECENHNQIEDFIRGQIRRRVFAQTEIKPVVFLHVFYEDDTVEYQ
ncbi:MAG: hypothetical protein J6Y91_03125, partial [Alphaproteobacteria bacterium]|nr:hypothetical protein [Alphaproteobacteria bacterium]